jgi:hypothetical protein
MRMTRILLNRLTFLVRCTDGTDFDARKPAPNLALNAAMELWFHGVPLNSLWCCGPALRVAGDFAAARSRLE